MKTQQIKNIGFVFGNGCLPNLLLEKCPQSICVLIKSMPQNITLSAVFKTFEITEIPQILDFFKQHGITYICLAGSVAKPKLNTKLFNFKILPLLWKILTLKNKGDNNLLTTILSYIENKGFQIISATEIIPNLLTQEGCLTNTKPKNNHFSSLTLAINFLNDISKYDISQACVVENNCIIALEGIEGTAKMISRTKEFNKGETILVKIPKKGQTLKVDMPTIGIETVKQCIEANICGIVLQAESTIILNKEEVISLANKHSIFIYSTA